MDHVKTIIPNSRQTIEPKRQPSWLFQYCLNPQNIPHCRKIQTLVNIIDRGKIFYLKHFWGCLIFRVAALNSIKTQVAVTPTLIKRALHHRLVHFYPLFCRKNKTCYLTCSITSNCHSHTPILSKLHTLYHSGWLDINDLVCQDQQFGIQSDFSVGSLTIQNIPE